MDGAGVARCCRGGSREIPDSCTGIRVTGERGKDRGVAAIMQQTEVSMYKRDYNHWTDPTTRRGESGDQLPRTYTAGQDPIGIMYSVYLVVNIPIPELSRSHMYVGCSRGISKTAETTRSTQHGDSLRHLFWEAKGLDLETTHVSYATCYSKVSADHHAVAVASIYAGIVRRPGSVGKIHDAHSGCTAP